MELDDNFVLANGKHQGKTIGAIKKIEPSYITWAIKNAPGLLKPKKAPIPAAPRTEPLEESNPNRSAMQPNMNFFQEKSEPIK